jgi:hypothetical protein
MKVTKSTRTAVAIFATALIFGGCADLSPTQQSTMTGAMGGAAGGALIGALAGNAGMGAAIGAGAGALGGFGVAQHRQAVNNAYQRGRWDAQQSAPRN